MNRINFENIIGFDWDEANINKSEEKHSVSFLESEQMFFNQPLLINFDEYHSQSESRFFALGKTNKDRLLMTVFTIRNNKIRVISSRDQSKKERKIYEKANS